MYFFPFPPPRYDRRTLALSPPPNTAQQLDSPLLTLTKKWKLKKINVKRQKVNVRFCFEKSVLHKKIKTKTCTFFLCLEVAQKIVHTHFFLRKFGVVR